MTIGKKSVLRKNSISNRLLCVFIAIALALLLVPAASIKAIAENTNKGEEVNQATEQSAEGTAEEQNADGTTDAKAEENATDSDSANLQANEGDNTEDANNDNQNPNADEPENAGGTVTVGFDNALGLLLYREVKTSTGKTQGYLHDTDTQTNITDAKVIYSETYKCNVLQITKPDAANGNTIISYCGMNEAQTVKGGIFSKDTGDFLTTSYSETLSEGKTLNFATTFPSTATIKTPESGTITFSEQSKEKLTYGTVYNHEAGSNTITFKYGGTTLATYTAAPSKAGYVLDDFWVTTDEAGTKRLETGSALSTDNVWLWASFKNENITIDFAATPTAGGKVSPATVQAKTGWSCEVDGNKITFYDEETTEKATVTATANEGYRFTKFTYLSSGVTKELEDGIYKDLTIFSGGITANFTDKNYASITYDKDTVKGDTVKNLVAAGWTAEESGYFKPVITFSKLFDKTSKVQAALDDFNGVKGTTFQKDNTTYQQAVYDGNATETMDKDVTFYPVFTFTLKTEASPKGSLDWDESVTPAPEATNFCSASYKVEGNVISFSDLTWFNTTTKKVLTYGEEGTTTLTATASAGWLFNKFNLTGQGDLSGNTTISATYDKAYQVKMNYAQGAPQDAADLTNYGWSYDAENKIATKSFLPYTDIESIFGAASTVWSNKCEPKLEGFAYEWSPKREGKLIEDTTFTALYIGQIKAEATPPEAATMSITPSGQVNYGDKVAEVTDTSIKIKRGEEKEVATISCNVKDGYMFVKWTAKDTTTGESIDLETLKTDGITTGVTFVAHLAAAHTLSVKYAKSTVKGETTKQFEEYGWTAKEDLLGLYVTYSKQFVRGSSIKDAVESFNSVPYVRFEKTGTTYQKAIYEGELTTFTDDVELTPIFTFKLAAYAPKTGTGTLEWDDAIAEEVEDVNFISVDYEAISTEDAHYVQFTSATYFDTETSTGKSYPKFNLTATPNTSEGYIFGKWNFEELSGKITKNAYFAVTFDKTYKISMRYGEGAPIKTSALEYYGWAYDARNHVASQSFVEGSDIAKIFEEYWSDNCEPTHEGYTASWDKPLKGELDSDKVFNAEYTAIVQHVTAAVNEEQPEAAKVKVTPKDPADVQYWDTIRVNDDNSIDVLRQGTLVKIPVASITFEASTSWTFKSWAAYDTNTGDEIDIEKLKTVGIKQDITFVATFEQNFVNVEFNDTYFKDRGSITYKKGEPTTYTKGFVAKIPQNYIWKSVKSDDELANPDIMQFINPDTEEVYSSATLSSSSETQPYVLYADEDAQVYKDGDSGYAYKSYTIYPTVFGESDYVTVTASVSSEDMGEVKCYQGETKLEENTIQASQPLEYAQEEREEEINTLTIKSKVGNDFYIQTTNKDTTNYYFLGWAYKLKDQTNWNWLEAKAGKLNVDAQVMAVYTEPIDVTFKVNKEERGTIEGETELTVKVPGEGTTYEYNANKVILSNDTYGYKQEIKATPIADPEHMYLFKKWETDAKEEGKIIEATLFTANFKEDFKVTMNAGVDGVFGVAPKGWNAETLTTGDIQYWKNFEENTTYTDITDEWKGYEPTRVGHTFNQWDADVEGETLIKTTTFTASWTRNPYKAAFYLNGGTVADPTAKGNWTYDSETKIFSNSKDYFYEDPLATVERGFNTAYGDITREDYTPTGEYYVYPEQEFFSQDTLFVPKYSYKLSVVSGEHGSVSPEGWSKSGIDEYDKTEVTVSDTGVLTLTINNAESGTPEVKTFVPSTDEGYQFANWTDKNGKELKTGDELVGNNEITANFELKEYNVSFFSGNPTLGEVNTTPESPQQITHFSKLIICKDEYKNYAYINKGGTETKVFEAWAVPEKETEARTYYFDNWTIMYPGGEITVDPSEGAEYTIEGPIDVRANFSQDYHRYNVLASIYTWDEPEGHRSSINPEIWHNVPYGSKAVANNHMVVITTPDQQMKTIECTPGTYSTQTAWYFGAEKMEEGVEYTITGTSLFTAELCEGSILKGQVTEEFTGYELQDVYLTFVYDKSTNGLDEEVVGPIVCDEQGNYEFEDPRIKTHASGTLYTFCAGYQVDSKDLYIKSGDNDVPVELKIQSGDLNMVSEADGHNCFDVTFEGTVTKQSGAVHKQEAEIHTTVPGTYTSLISGETYKGTTFTFNEDSISTYYEAEMVPEETNADVEKYYEQSQIVPVAKDGYKFSHFIYNDKEVAPGEKITIEANEEYNISAVYEVVPVDALGTGTGSTGDSNWVLFLIVGLVLVAAGVGIGYGLYRKNKGNAAGKNNSGYTPKH